MNDLQPNVQTTLHVAQEEGTGDYVATVITPGGAYLTLKFLSEHNLLLLGTQTSPQALDLFTNLQPKTVHVAGAADLTELAQFLVLVANAIEEQEGNVNEAAAKLFTEKPAKEEAPEEEPKPKRKTRRTKNPTKNAMNGED